MSTYMAADQSRHRRTDPSPTSRLPLHAELYLLAHDDDTGEPHISVRSTALGLAGALLVGLAMNEQVAVGLVYNHLDGTWRPEKGRLTRTVFDAVADPLSDAALAAVDQSTKAGLGDRQVREFLRTHAAGGLYERVQAHLITVGLIQRVSHRKFGLVRTERNVPVDRGFAIRARARVRNAVAFHRGLARYDDEQADDQCAALSGLAAVLGLAEFDVLSNMPARRFSDLLLAVVEQHGDDAISSVIAAVDAARGDLAVAAMR
jgi:hypothetical protein